MMADGFVIVQCGKMNEVKPIALDLSNYAKAIGAGERVNRHAASLLKNAEDGDLGSFKNNLALIQSDVEQELASLRDSDMANLIGLGGWIRALDAATAALDNKFSEDKAKVIFSRTCRNTSITFWTEWSGNEGTPGHRQNHGTADHVAGADDAGTGAKPTKAGVEALRKTTLKLMKAALAPAES